MRVHSHCSHQLHPSSHQDPAALPPLPGTWPLQRMCAGPSRVWERARGGQPGPSSSSAKSCKGEPRTRNIRQQFPNPNDSADLWKMPLVQILT